MKRSVPDNHEYYLFQIQGKLLRCFLVVTSKFYLSICVYLGARRYLMKEPDSSIPACKRRLQRIMIFDRTMRILLFGWIFYKILTKYNFFGFNDFVMGTR